MVVTAEIAGGRGPNTWFITKDDIVKLRMLDGSKDSAASAAETLDATHYIKEVNLPMPLAKEYQLFTAGGRGVKKFPSFAAAEMYARMTGANHG